MSIPAQVLGALQTDLASVSSLSKLPSALQLFAYLTVVAESVRAEATLMLNFNAHGKRPNFLTGIETAHLQRCKSKPIPGTGRRLNSMRQLSLDLRRAHLRQLCSEFRDVQAITDLLDLYFPEYDEGQADHKMLFISYAGDDELGHIAEYRAEVEGWIENAEVAQEHGEALPVLPEFTSLEQLAAKVVRQGNEAVVNAERMLGIFSPAKKPRAGRASLPAQPAANGVRGARPRLSMPDGRRGSASPFVEPVRERT